MPNVAILSDDDCTDSVQSPPAHRRDSRELSQWTNVGVVVHPRPPNYTHQEDRVPEVYVPPDSTADAERVPACTDVTAKSSYSSSSLLRTTNIFTTTNVRIQDLCYDLIIVAVCTVARF